MVNELLEVSKHFKDVFDSFVGLDFQVALCEKGFLEEKEKWLQTAEAKVKFLEMQNNPRARGYFLTKRQFKEGLVPKEYHRTKAPRISTTGSTFHGMKNNLKWRVIHEITRRFNVTIVDFDFSGAHAVIATRLQPKHQTLLKRCVNSPSF